MVILESPYVSAAFCDYLGKEKIPVLHNAFSEKLAHQHALRLIEPGAFGAALASGKRLYTNSENALDWVYTNCTNSGMLDSIRLMKDKYAFRKALRPMYPEYTFQEVPAAALRDVQWETLQAPLIIKPSVGFFSMGVYAVFTRSDWDKALDAIESSMLEWRDAYPQTVLGESRFLLEELIAGEEYAVDCYFDDQGKAVILNIMEHTFSSGADVSDRLYSTSKAIIESKLAPFTRFLDKANTLINARNFPAHVELRVSGSRIFPVEFNPMRFAGWCTTDIADHAYGINTCDFYLNDRRPDWASLLAGKDGIIYSLIILDKPERSLGLRDLDQSALCAHFSKVLELRCIEERDCPVFGFLFAETPEAQRAELDAIVHSKLTEFLKK